MIAIYHSKDLDGWCSGAIIKLKYPDAVLIGYDYGEEFPWDKIPVGEPVIMADVSLPPTQMLDLAHRTNYQLTWIDHHISAYKEYYSVYDELMSVAKINYIYELNKAACELCWKYFFPDEKMPLAVQLLGEYDTWRQVPGRWEEEILPFQYGMRQRVYSPETFPSHLFIESNAGDFECAVILDEGKAILNYQKGQNKAACKFAFETTFEGLRAICLNQGGASSLSFESKYDPEKHDLMIPFVFSGAYWKFSLYATKPGIDCSVIAKKYGGGGHSQASGMQVDTKTAMKILGINV